MADFANGKIHVLVSTTVIEVGINVPRATLMIVEDADRFGLAQLHQLRGRVGRGKAESHCVLVSCAKGEEARARLETMSKTNDGFKVAEEDLKQRGPGDFIGGTDGSIRQSGGLAFRFASLCDNADLLSVAAEDAREILEARKSDADARKETDLLLEEAYRLFETESSHIS